MSPGAHGGSLLVMSGGDVKLSQEDVCVAEVTVTSPLRRLIPKLFSDQQALRHRTTTKTLTIWRKYVLQKLN